MYLPEQGGAGGGADCGKTFYEVLLVSYENELT